jgi:hypothetical protein
MVLSPLRWRRRRHQVVAEQIVPSTRRLTTEQRKPAHVTQPRKMMSVKVTTFHEGVELNVCFEVHR